MPNDGFVYVMHNCEHRQPSVKIGLSRGPVERRAKTLDSTGSPGKFIPLFSVYVSDCGLVESLVHERLAEFRTRPEREFFRVSPDRAIHALIELSSPYLLAPLMSGTEEPQVEVLSTLLKRYEGLLDKYLTSVTVGPYETTVVLTCAFKRFLVFGDLSLERTDLNIITDFSKGSAPLFEPAFLDDAVKTFLGLDPYTYIMTTPLFGDDDARLIARVLEGRRDMCGDWDNNATATKVIELLAADVRRGARDRNALIHKYTRLPEAIE